MTNVTGNRADGRATRGAYGTKGAMALAAGLALAASARAWTVTNYTVGASDAVQRNIGAGDIIEATSGVVTGQVVTGKDLQPVFQFPIAALPPAGQITSATIGLYVDSCVQDIPVQFRTASGTGTVTYDPGVEDGTGQILVGTITNGASGWVTFNVTANLQAAKTAGYTWATFFLGRYAGGNGFRISVEAAESATPARRPYLAATVNPTMSVLSAGGATVSDNEAPDLGKGTFFGSVAIGTTLTNTFTITNASPAPLTITGVTTGGADAAQFLVEGVPATVDAGGSAAFTIAFTPAAVASYAAMIGIANDSTTTPYRINVAGNGPLLPPVATAATGVTGTGFSANWDPALGATNYRLDVATTDAFAAGDMLAGYDNLAVGDVATYPVAGLLGHRTYYYRLRAEGVSGATDNSNVIGVALPDNPPVAQADGFAIDEDAGATAMNVLTNDTDADGDTLVVDSVTPGVGSVAVDPGGTGVTYTPAANWNGTDTFTYVVSDGFAGGTNETTVTVVVAPVNDVPSFTAGAGQTVDEDAGAQSVPGWASDISAGASNESAQVLTFVVENDNNALFSSQPAVAADGTLTYTTAPDANGQATVSVSLTDDDTAGGGALTSAVQTISIAVNAVNDMPSFTAGGNQTVDEDAGAQSVPGWASAISAGPSNESAQVLTFVVENDNNALFSSQPAVAADGTLAFTPAPDSNGMATVSVSLTDDATAGGGALTTAVQTFTITINAVNDPPVAAPDSAETWEDAAVTINVLTNDTDVDGHTLSVDSATPGAHGDVIWTATDVTYTPSNGWSGTDSFAYTVSDGAGGLATGTVTVLVIPFPTFVVTAPAEGAALVAGGPIEIKWQGTPALGSADIAIWSGTDQVATLTSGLPSASTDMTWIATLPVNLVPGLDYRVAVAQASDTNNTAFSGAFAIRKTAGDFDGDGKADLAIFRRVNGRLRFRASSDGHIWRTPFCDPAWLPAVADYDGDGLADAAWYVPATGAWRILESSNGNAERTPQPVFGDAAGIPQAADIDGDGKADLVLFSRTDGKIRIRESSDGYEWTTPIGRPAWLPAVADYDGDGLADPAWFAPASGRWHILESGNGYIQRSPLPVFGGSGCVPVPADFDGDGQADLAVFKSASGKIRILESSDGFVWTAGLGLAGSMPAVADYDGDGLADPAWYVPALTGKWHILESSNAYAERKPRPAFGREFARPIATPVQTPGW